MSNEQELRVGGTTNVHELATAMVRYIEEGKSLVLSCIGVQAVSQAAKSTAIANGKVAPTGRFFSLHPWFAMTQLPDSDGSGNMVDRTVIKFTVLSHRPALAGEG